MVNRAVVDACLAFCAKNPSPTNEGASAFYVLDALKNEKASVVFCSTLLGEWDKHSSKYSLLWMTYMVSKNRVILAKKSRTKSSLKSKIRRSVPKTYKNVIHAMEKDAHLFAAAIDYDDVIISFNDKEALQYKKYLGDDARIGKIMWANPISEFDVLDWIATGLPKIKDKTISQL